MTDHSGRKVRSHEKARLGVAAEHPDRAGLPRRHNTEHHTEVQMPAFDPKQMKQYIPPGYVSLETAFEIISYHYADLFLRTWRDEPTTVEENPVTLEYFRNDREQVLSNWIDIRHCLATGALKSYVMKSDGEIYMIDRSIWVGSDAPLILSEGRIPTVGPIVVSDEQLRDIIDRVRKGKHVVDNNMPVFSESDKEKISHTIRHSKDIFDKDLFYRIVCCEIYENGLPDGGWGSQKNFRQKLIDEYIRAGGAGGAPSDHWVRKKILPIQQRLRASTEIDQAFLSPPDQEGV